MASADQTVNCLSANHDSLCIWLVKGSYLRRLVYTANLQYLDYRSLRLHFHQIWGWNQLENLTLCRPPHSEFLHPRVSVVRWYAWVMSPDDIEEQTHPTTLAFTPNLDSQLVRKPAWCFGTGSLQGVTDTLCLANHYTYITRRDTQYCHMWVEVDLYGGPDCDSMHMEPGGTSYRTLHIGDFVPDVGSDEAVIQSWSTGHWDPFWWKHDFTTTCLSLAEGKWNTLWHTETEELLLQHVFHPARAIVGTSGRISYRKWDDSLVVFVDYRYGIPYDTVFLGRSLQALKFFETSGPTLNLVGRTYDTIFVYQFQVSTDADERSEVPIRPRTFVLRQDYPNPFNGGTVIEMDNPRRQQVRLAVYNVLGQQVTEIHNGTMPSGPASFSWDGCSVYGKPLPTGVYFARLETKDATQTIKMLLLK